MPTVYAFPDFATTAPLAGTLTAAMTDRFGAGPLARTTSGVSFRQETEDLGGEASPGCNRKAASSVQ